jgi:hypothetical protein
MTHGVRARHDQLTNAALAAWFGEISGTEASFQCSPCMSSRSDEYRQRAAEAKNRAAQTSNLSIKSAFEDVARGWLLLSACCSCSGQVDKSG